MKALWGAMTSRGKLLLAVLVVVLLAAPFAVNRYLLSVLTLILYFVYVGQAWNLMMGYAGQLSLGHALYVGLGGYVAAALWVHFGIGPWLGLFPAVAVAAAFGAAIGWLGFRFGIEGVYFALLTIAFAEFTRIGFDHIAFTGGAGGLFLPYEEKRLGEWWNLRGGQHFFYYLAFVLASAGVLLTALLSRARLGFQWLAIREDEIAAQALGIDVFRAKMKAVLISSGMTAVGGVFYAIELILAPIVGGLGTIFGPVIGAFILTPLGEVLIAATERLGVNAPGVKALFFGLTLMIIISLVPTGVWPWIARRLELTKR
jgi:branched-chain amino acid transport system permease protein